LQILENGIGMAPGFTQDGMTYSTRGSTRVAWRAGTSHAASATNARIVVATLKVTASLGFTSKSKLDIKRMSASAAIRPSASPRAARVVNSVGRNVKRGEIWTVAGGKDYARKPRPVVILQDDHWSCGSRRDCFARLAKTGLP
jgi:hypothetical protein